MARRRSRRSLDGLPLAVDVRPEGASACVKHDGSWYCRPTLTRGEAERRVECLRRKLWFSRKRSVPGVVRAFAEGRVC